MGSLIEARRRVLLASGQSSVIDTSPKIAESGVYWGRGQGTKNADAAWGITDFYYFSPQPQARCTFYGFVGNDGTQHTFQYYSESGNEKDWWYFGPLDYRGTSLSNDAYYYQISFSIELAEIDNVYCYAGETGQIFFAGRNTPYYGYTNINDMPQGN